MGYALLFPGCRVIYYILLFQGCKLIGYAGSEEKVKFLKDLEFDFAFNYRKVNLSESLKEAAPEGVDVFYDGVFIFTVFVWPWICELFTVVISISEFVSL